MIWLVLFWIWKGQLPIQPCTYMTPVLDTKYTLSNTNFAQINELLLHGIGLKNIDTPTAYSAKILFCLNNAIKTYSSKLLKSNSSSPLDLAVKINIVFLL